MCQKSQNPFRPAFKVVSHKRLRNASRKHRTLSCRVTLYNPRYYWSFAKRSTQDALLKTTRAKSIFPSKHPTQAKQGGVWKGKCSGFDAGTRPTQGTCTLEGSTTFPLELSGYTVNVSSATERNCPFYSACKTESFLVEPLRVEVRSSFNLVI